MRKPLTPITYTLENGSLPIGLHLMTDGRILGSVAYENFYPVPNWITPSGRIIDTLKLSEVETYIEATPTTGATSMVYSLVPSPITGQVLPWGITLEYDTGKVSGTLPDVDSANEPWWNPDETPIWETPSGQIIDLPEMSTVSFTLEAIPYEDHTIYYSVLQGSIPIGLQLNYTTGEIFGKISRIPYPIDLIPEVTPKPIWGSLEDIGTFHVGDSVSVDIVALPLGNAPINNYTIVSGSMPFGIFLTNDGDLSGKILRYYYDYVPEYDTITFNFNDNVLLINGVVGQTVSRQLEYTVDSGRTLTDISVVNKPNAFENLPFGLTLNNTTGLISGTVRGLPGTYTVEIEASDNKYAISKKTFRIRVGE